MNIIDFLKENSTSVTLIYYGKNDMASGFQIKTLIDNKNEIIDYYEKADTKINNLNEYIDYIFVDTYSQLSEMIPMVRDDLKETVSDILEKLKETKENYKKSEINKFIKHNYNILLSRDKLKTFDLRAYEIIEYTLNYIKKNYKVFNGDLEIYKYIVNNYYYRIFHEYEDYKDIVLKYPELQVILFSREIIENQIYNRISDLIEPLKALKKSNKDLYKKVVEQIYTIIKNKFFNTDFERVLYSYNNIKEATYFFERIGESRYYNEFSQELKIQSKILNEYIHKRGHSSKFEIDLGQLELLIKDPKTKWEVKSLMITHTRINQKMQTRLQSAIENESRPSLLEKIASTNRDVNDYFTYSVQNRLSITIMLEKMMINFMLSDDDRFKELMNYLFAGIVNYIEKNNINILNIEDDFNMLSFSLKNVMVEREKEKQDSLINEYYNYNAIHLCVGIIEKVLREISYTILKMNQYVPYTSLTIENILKSPELESFLGEANVRTIRYFFFFFNSVGKNLRNDICHYNNNIKDISTYDNTLIVVFILLTISNELLLKIIDK